MKEGNELTAEELIGAVGAIVFASGEPVQTAEMAEALDVSRERIEEAVAALGRVHDQAETGLLVERIAGGVRLATRPAVGATVRRFFRHRNRTRLSPAALETLAILAYRQPVTAPEIQAIRGKDPSSALKNLVDKKLVRILGKKKVVGSPLLYGTSKQFLVHFGLDSLDEMPSMEEFDGFVDALGGGWPEAGQGNGEDDEAVEGQATEERSAGDPAPHDDLVAPPPDGVQETTHGAFPEIDPLA